MQSIAKSIVKIFTTANIYNYVTPWLPPSQEKFTGSGFVIDGKRIMTNAHVIANHAFVEVRNAISGTRFSVTVDSVGHDCDLAILRPKDDKFFAEAVALELGDMPRIQDRVKVFGFPIGGDEISITAGIVSRIETQEYAHSGVCLPSCQIDAAINPGNSGGPVLSGNKVVGVAHQGYDSGQNLGYMIPINVIQHFMQDIKSGTYKGFPGVGFQGQIMENPDIRKKFKMHDKQSGILMTKINVPSAVEKLLKTDDVLLAVNGVKIANDGTVRLDNDLRLGVGYLFSRSFIGDTLNLDILRDGSNISLKIVLRDKIGFDMLVTRRQYDIAPDYYIYGGLVFQPLTQNYLESYGENWTEEVPKSFVYHYTYGMIKNNRRELVIINTVLSDEVNIGYQEVQDVIVKQINGKVIGCTKDVIMAIEQHDGEYTEIVSENDQKIILDHRKALSGAKRILDKYQITKDRSFI